MDLWGCEVRYPYLACARQKMKSTWRLDVRYLVTRVCYRVFARRSLKA